MSLVSSAALTEKEFTVTHCIVGRRPYVYTMRARDIKVATERAALALVAGETVTVESVKIETK